MKLTKKRAIMSLVLLVILAVFAVMKIKVARYASVQLVWKVIDSFDTRNAKSAALPTGIKIESDIPYIQDGLKEHKLDVYYPEAERGDLPMIVNIHGGGFVAGDKVHTQQYCMTLAQKGYVVFNMNYRLAPQAKHPAQIADVMDAMTWVKIHSSEYHGDKSKIALAGDSAGAYLAGLAGCICTNPGLAEIMRFKPAFTGKEVKGVLLFSGLYDLETGAGRKFPSIRSDIELLLGTSDINSYPVINSLSIIKNVTADYPDVFISSGEVDGLYPESIALIKVLERNHIKHETCLFDKKEKNAFHDYQKQLNLDTSKKCMRQVEEFLTSIFAS